MLRHVRVWCCAVAAGLALLAGGSSRADDTILLDFENPADLSAWSPVSVGAVPGAPPKPAADAAEVPVPPPAPGTQPDTGATAPKAELSDRNVTHGKTCLKITFHGGAWPGLVNSLAPGSGNWHDYHRIKLDITTETHCIAGLRITQRKDPNDFGAVWERTIYLLPGRNEVEMYLHPGNGWWPIDDKFGDVASVVIYMYRPTEGQTLYVDNVRLDTDKPRGNTTADPVWAPIYWFGHSMANYREFAESGKLVEFKVAGTKMTVGGVCPLHTMGLASRYESLGGRLRGGWVKPAARTVEEVEADFRARYEEIKKTRPKAVLAVFRDGQKGFDPGDPEKVYAGWKDTFISCHSPEGPGGGREGNSGRNETLEVFMRHRSLLAQADLTSIRRGSRILAAQLVLNRVPGSSRDATKMPTMWVAEACARDWDEYQVNCYQYADGKLWKAISGQYYGDDPDFLPLFLAFGPGQGPCNAWDFTEAVRFWTTGRHRNFGFMFHGDAEDYFVTYSRECREVKLRPAIMVIYEPGR